MTVMMMIMMSGQIFKTQGRWGKEDEGTSLLSLPESMHSSNGSSSAPSPPVPHTRYFKELVVVAERAAFKVKREEPPRTEEKSTAVE